MARSQMVAVAYFRASNLKLLLDYGGSEGFLVEHQKTMFQPHVVLFWIGFLFFRSYVLTTGRHRGKAFHLEQPPVHVSIWPSISGQEEA